jgi:hypothetical protein
MNRNTSLMGSLKSRLLGISAKEVSFSRRGFPDCSSRTRRHLESVIGTFIEGYNIAVGTTDVIRLADRLDATFSPAFVGFAYEGAGLYLGLLDLLLPRSKSRLSTFTHSVAQDHDYITSVGAGFAIARMPFGLRRLESYQRTLDPRVAWCLADGYGFHQGFFHWKRFIEAREAAPGSLSRQNRHLFDAGVGRAMWWVFGADPVLVASAISRFDTERQPEMWAGIGTALAYAGGGPPEASSLLFDLAGQYRLDLLSGIPFAAHMREKGRNPADWTDRACSVLLNMSVSETSDMIVTELNTYLDSWQGSEQERWNECYLALRDRVKRCLQNGRDRTRHRFAWAKTGPEGEN